MSSWRAGSALTCAPSSSIKVVPKLVVPDNTKTGVTKACRYDPDLNPTYQDGALHQVGQPLPLAGLSPVIRIISLTYESIRMILEAWPPDPFPKSPLPRRFQPPPK